MLLQLLPFWRWSPWIALPLLGTVLSFLNFGPGRGHVHQGLGLGTFVVGLVAGSRFAASLVSRVWSGRYADSRGAKRAALPRECGRMGFSGTTAAVWPRAYGDDRRAAACQQLVGPRAKFIVIRELDGMGSVGRAARAKLAE